MLSVSELGDRIRDVFPDATQVSDTAIRFLRSDGDRPYAVCYVDVTSDLPHDPESLTRFQDRTIGKHYFEGRRSLQWSNYLYFLQPTASLRREKTLKAKRLIEADRSYARKYVYGEDKLDEILAPPTIVAPEVGDQTSIMSTWTRKLVQPGLYDAVFKDASMPKRLSLIEKGSGKAPSEVSAMPLMGPRKPPPHIKTFVIKRTYRRFPKKRDYEFGRVNLFVGPNAVGKTSLLEAIELFYCGRTKRNLEGTPSYAFHATFVDGTEETASDGRARQVFRNRNLEWYGQSEVRTNDLCQSFALFNFLDTDAAVRIADSAVDLDDNLSRLLVGPDAATVWRNIERVYEAVVSRAEDVATRCEESGEERDLLAEQLKSEEGLSKESDGIRRRLDVQMRKLKWSYPPADDDDEESRVASLVSTLTEYASLAAQAAELAWIASPASLQQLDAFVTASTASMDKADAAIKTWAELNTLSVKREAELTRLNGAAAQAREAKLLITAGVPSRTADLMRHQAEMARLAEQLAGTETLRREAFQPFLTIALNTAQRRIRTARTKAEADLGMARKQLAEFNALRENAQRLAQQLRGIAEVILKDAAVPDICPLCHTRFEEGGLVAHMHKGVDPDVEATGQALIQRVRARDAALKAAVELEEQFDVLAEFGGRAGAPRVIEVAGALKLLEERSADLAEANSAFNRIDTELQNLRARNLSQDRFERAVAELSRIGHPLRTWSLESVTVLESSLSNDISTVGAHLANLASEIEQLRGDLQRRVAIVLASVDDARAAVSQLKARQKTTQNLLSKILKFAKHFPWPKRAAFADLQVVARHVRSLAAEFLTALEREEQRKEAHSEIVERKEELDKRLAELEPVRDRLVQARKTLERLRREDNLEDAMRSALQANRKAIEEIFARIHAPQEFGGLGEDFQTLRRTNGDEANLSEISTGQRAAFALSIFLARNAQLIAAPPVLLIDDPIAHVDDLNALSFLDYLRTLVTTGGRQVFFATANDKIATLFQRKFDFLEDFQRFDLTRG